MPIKEIEDIKTCFVNTLKPVKVYLFGSFANQTNTEESDLDFYIVVNNETNDIAEETARAYKSIRNIKKHPVDIIVGSENRFESRKNISSIENEVYKKGILLYEARNE
ncbi:MAG: nucleotidyltransferase domain-containing protein [Clostridiales bacterium]|nr:nucleotidyltransferase domain-containing protein [Clostridiales bacterium]